MGNTNSSSGTSKTPGENENMETLFIGIALVIAAVVIYLIINNSNCKKRHRNRYSIETYINDSKTILRDMTNTSLSLAKYAQDYVTERTNRESSFRSYVDGGTAQLNLVKSEHQKAKKAYDNATNISAINLNSAVSDASQNAGKAERAYQSIVDSSSGGNLFGSALKNIQIQKSTADTAFDQVKSTITEIEIIYTGISSAESAIVVSYNNANISLSSFRAFINTLISNINTSYEYVNLQSNVQKASTLKTNLEGIASELGQDDQYYGEVQTLIDSLNTAIGVSTGYLNNSITIFELATRSADAGLNASILQLVSTYNLMVTYIDGRTESSVIPLSQPLQEIPIAEGRTIKSYVEQIKIVAGTVIANYNRVIDYYNRIITNLNLIQTFTSTVHNEVGNVSDTFNKSLDQAGDIMKNYLPGSTIPPRTPYPNYTTNTPFPTLTTRQPM